MISAAVSIKCDFMEVGVFEACFVQVGFGFDDCVDNFGSECSGCLGHVDACGGFLYDVDEFVAMAVFQLLVEVTSIWVARNSPRVTSSMFMSMCL